MKLHYLAASLLATLAISAHAADKAPHWSYQGKTAAEKWGSLDESFATCKIGKDQSPIDIRGAKKGELAPLDFKYAKSGAEVVNNGHTIQVNLADAGTLNLDGSAYKLLQFHFHTPSEEKINGKAYPMVAHLVHKNDDGKLAVVAVLLTQGKPNAALAPVFASMPKAEGGKKAVDAGLDVAELLPAERGYYKFTGSLTTPPCSEGVRWQVLKTPVQVSAAQIASFRKLYKMNARPVQPLNDRKVEES